MEKHIVRSYNGLDVQEQLEGIDRPLQSPGYTTLGLLMLSSRMASASAQKGGIREHRVVSQLQHVVNSFLDVAPMTDWALTIAFDDDWKLMWPRPNKVAPYSVELKVVKGRVNLGPWVVLMREHSQRRGINNTPLYRWWGAVKAYVGQGNAVNLVTLLRAPSPMNTTSDVSHFWAQVVWHTSHYIEKQLLAEAADPSSEQPVVFHVEASSQEWAARAVDICCVDHVHASRVAQRGHRQISIATDKANSAIVLTNNVGFELAPQVRVSTDLPGLSFAMLRPLIDQGVAWRLWPHLSDAGGQGADEVAGARALMFRGDLRLNMARRCDPAHGCNRDFWLTCSECGVEGLVYLGMIAMNIACGPGESDACWEKITDAMNDHYKNSPPKTSPIFQHFSARIIRELGGAIAKVEGQTVEDAAWTFMRERSAFGKKQYKVNQGRYLAVASEGTQLCKMWWSFCFELMVVGLEVDALKTKALTKIKMITSGHDVTSNLDGTSKRTTSVDSRTLRSGGLNALVISGAVISDDHHRRLLATVFGLHAPVKHWWGRARKSLADVATSQQWVSDQLTGGIIEHCVDIVTLLETQSFLEFSGFILKGPALGQMTEEEIGLEDEFADRACTCAFALVKNRLR
ncbi:unnamed protein product, partial [Prorocentrum cordatum]